MSRLEEVNADGPPDQEPWQILFLVGSVFVIGIIVGIGFMMFAARAGWWDYL